MGECCCTQIQGDLIVTVGKATLSIDIYRGCKECAPLIGIDVRAFNKQGVTEWLDGNTGQSIEPNEYGGPGGQVAACLELFSVDDLADAAAKYISMEMLEAYEGDVRECFVEHGLHIVQAALSGCETRKRESRKEVSNG